MIDSKNGNSEFSVAGILVKTILWLAVGVGRRPRRGGDELAALWHEVERPKSENTILRRRLRGNRQTHHTWKEKLHILWHMEVFGVPRRQVEKVFGISRSTYYRCLRQAESGALAGRKENGRSPANKTSNEIALLVWRIFNSNPLLGREKIAQMIQRLNVFLSPSVVRNITQRQSRKTSKSSGGPKRESLRSV